MTKFLIPIVLAGLTILIVLLGGLFGGVPFLVIIKRIFMYGLLMGGLGFILDFLLMKWNVLPDSSDKDTAEESESAGVGLEGENLAEGEAEAPGEEVEASKPVESEGSQGETSDSVFDYTVKDDDDVEFKPLDDSIIAKDDKKYMEVNGEKIEYDPQKAAMAIRQLLNEDDDGGE